MDAQQCSGWGGRFDQTTRFSIGYLDGQSWIEILGKLCVAMTTLDFFLLAVGVPCFAYAFTPQRYRLWERREEVQAWKIPGARQDRFKLYQAACLLVGEEPEWPLTSQLSRDEYRSLVEAVEAFELEIVIPDSSPIELLKGSGNVTKALQDFELGWRRGAEDQESIRNVEVMRLALRSYLSSISRPIPEFLDERFDPDPPSEAEGGN